MKSVLSVLLLLGAYLLQAQQTYTGTASLIPKGPDFNATYYRNQISMTVDAGGNAVLTPRLKFGPTTDPGDYVAFEGSISGTLSGGELSLNGSLQQSMQDGKRFTETDVTTRVSGQLQGTIITGTFYLRYDGKEESTWTFTLRAGESAPELLFPLGASPKVFDQGWLFGARFILPGKDREDIDLSESVEWSGTGQFEPAKGASCRPVFSHPGKNKIILTVQHEGKKYQKEFAVEVVSSLLYARVGARAFAPSDAHGCPGCPHPVSGVVISGSTQVLIGGLPVACEGDRGVQAGCCGPNQFVISGGDDNVRINGRRVAMIGSPTTHCGGRGHIVASAPSGEIGNSLQALSGDVSLTLNGKKLSNNSPAKTGTTIKTGPKGLLLLQPDQHTALMLWPSATAVVKDASGKNMVISLENGTVSVNGTSEQDNRELVIETLKEIIERKGTRFVLSHQASETRLFVYEGLVQVRLRDDNSVITVPAGKQYINDFRGPWRLEDTARFAASDLLKQLPGDSIAWTTPPDGVPPTIDQGGTVRALLKKYWYLPAGMALLIGLVLFFGLRKKT